MGIRVNTNVCSEGVHKLCYRKHFQIWRFFEYFYCRNYQSNSKQDMNNDLSAFEKIPVKVFNTSEEASKFVAKQVADLIKARQAENKPVVLGLATGSTPTRL